MIAAASVRMKWDKPLLSSPILSLSFCDLGISPLVLAFRNVSTPARKVSNLSPAKEEKSFATDISGVLFAPNSFNYQSTQGRDT